MKQTVCEHAIELDLASGVHLQIRYFPDCEQRWIFSHHYVGRHPGETPQILNSVRLVANYTDGLLRGPIVLSMHLVLPNRLGKQLFLGVDISPGAKTYLEFNYEGTAPMYRLTEIRKGARERVRFGEPEAALIKTIAFPFPVPDRLLLEAGRFQVPFRTNTDAVEYFNLPVRTLFRSSGDGRSQKPESS